MQSIFSQAKRIDMIAVCHEALKNTGDEIKKYKIRALKQLGGRILHNSGPQDKLREEWLEVYASLCRYQEIDHSKFPNVNTLSYNEWCRVKAYETTKILAKTFKLDEDLLPIDFKPQCKIDARFSALNEESVLVGRGNMILPHLTAKPPTVEVRSSESHAKPFYTIMMLDLDRPNTDCQRRIIYSHWLRTNVCEANPVGMSVHKYEPVCPERGSGVHRYAILAIGHDDKVNVGAELSRQSFDIAHFLSITKGTLQGLSFFRTVWTKQIESIVPNMRTFGEVQEEYHGPPISRFSIY